MNEPLWPSAVIVVDVAGEGISVEWCVYIVLLSGNVYNEQSMSKANHDIVRYYTRPYR